MIQDAPVVDLGQRLGKIAGYGDTLAWSEYDASDATFRLVVRQAGRPPSKPKIAPRNRPFDVDVGPDRDGRPALVYSRCQREPKRPTPTGLYVANGLPPYPGGSGCDVYKYAGGRERKLSDLSTHDAEEFMPSLWRGTVAFVRQDSPGRPGRLYLNDRDGSPSRQLRRLRLGDDVVSTDLRGRRLAYEMDRLADECARIDVTTVGESVYTYLSIVEPHRKPRIVARSCSNDSRQNNLAGGVWSGSTLIYSADSGMDYENGRIVARAASGQQRTLATYAFPNAFNQYLAANDHGIFAAVRRDDGRSHISRLLEPE